VKQLILTITIFVLLYTNLSAQLVPTTKRFGKCGYCKEGTKDFIISPDYDKCGEVVNGTMIVTKGKYDGLIDTFGNILIDFKNNKLRYNGSNIVSYERENGDMLYDINGVPLLQEYMNAILRSDPNNPYFISVKDKKYGFISETGATIQTMIFDSIFHTNNTNYYFFKDSGKFGIMNKTGNIIHHAIFDNVNKISNDSIMVKKDGEWYIWSSTDSSYIKGQLKEPLPDILPCYDCSSCPEYGLNPRTKNHCASSKLLSFIYKNVKYPINARADRIEGTVVVDFMINIDGSTSDFEVKEKLGYELDEAAIDVCKKLKFERAATFEGTFIPMQYKIPIKFKLE
jgi:TonB family protein